MQNSTKDNHLVASGNTDIPVITVDGTSGVGKGTVCALLSNHFSWHFLDSGAIYRLTALHALQSTIDLGCETAVVEHLQSMEIAFSEQRISLNNNDVTELIREEVVGQTASKIATYPKLRAALLDYQRGFRRAPGLVADGRDMGTVVFPNAVIKVFLTASLEARAQRRYKQLNDKGKSVSLLSVLAELEKRDQRDSSRQVAPLEPAKDAVVIDTTEMDATSVFKHILDVAQARGVLPQP